MPLICFAKGATHSIEGTVPLSVIDILLFFVEISRSAYDVVGLDWTADPATARRQIQGNASIQVSFRNWLRGRTF